MPFLPGCLLQRKTFVCKVRIASYLENDHSHQFYWYSVRYIKPPTIIFHGGERSSSHSPAVVGKFFSVQMKGSTLTLLQLWFIYYIFYAACYSQRRLSGCLNH